MGKDRNHYAVRSSGVARIDTKQQEHRQALQDGYPTFVPTFVSLRAACLQRTREQLLELETQIDFCEDEVKRDGLLDRATALLRELDEQLKANVKWRQLEDPIYAAQRGLSLTHFTMDSAKRNDHWMLLTSNFGVSANSIIESDPSQLASRDRDWLEEFCGGDVPPTIAFKRKKTMLERQRGGVLQHGKIVTPNPGMKRLWAFLISLGVAVSIGFLAVAIIATTTEFHPLFIKYFFWIAIVWVLAASATLVALVRAFGASGKDSLSVFLATVAIYLVIIQIGQTKLYGQLQGEAQ
ncbi:unnamed protein product [Periconia digitata]|uniref:Uncharacterized protein n=1 Tax=Periconia digitata TaxID=1303443 RepID=A0A9W4UT18_9PLEO|nr:unnamed protein product [Periconia digitata]